MRPKGGIEQARRDLMRSDPDLYRYIEALVSARELDRAGDHVSGALDPHDAANRLWALSVQWLNKRDRIRDDDDAKNARQAEERDEG